MTSALRWQLALAVRRHAALLVAMVGVLVLSGMVPMAGVMLGLVALSLALVSWGARLVLATQYEDAAIEEFRLTRGSDPNAVFAHRWWSSVAWLSAGLAAAAIGHAWALHLGGEWVSGHALDRWLPFLAGTAGIGGVTYLVGTVLLLHPRGPLGATRFIVILLLPLALMVPFALVFRERFADDDARILDTLALVILVALVAAGATTFRVARRWWRDAGRLEPQGAGRLERRGSVRPTAARADRRTLGDRGLAALDARWPSRLRSPRAAVLRHEIESAVVGESPLLVATVLWALPLLMPSNGAPSVILLAPLGLWVGGGVGVLADGGPFRELLMTRGATRDDLLAGHWLAYAATLLIGALATLAGIACLAREPAWAEGARANVAVTAIAALVGLSVATPDALQPPTASALAGLGRGLVRIVGWSAAGAAPILLALRDPALLARATSAVSAHAVLVVLGAAGLGWGLHLRLRRGLRTRAHGPDAPAVRAASA